MIEDLIGAIVNYTKTIELNPKDIVEYINSCDAKQEIKDFNCAIEDLKNAIELKPNYQNGIDTISEEIRRLKKILKYS